MASLSHHQVPVTVATLQDVPDIVALAQKAYRGDTAKRGWTHEAELLDGQRTDSTAVLRLVEAPNSVILTIRDAVHRLVCCCNVALAAPDDGPALAAHPAYFGLFAVDPDLQNGGIGKRMMVAAEDYARRDLHAQEMRMTVISQRKELIDWYIRKGYKSNGEKQAFPGYADNRFGVPKRADLTFTVLIKPL